MKILSDNKPTRVTANTRTCLDFFISNFPERSLKKVGTIDTSLSDHYTQVLSIGLNTGIEE